MFGVVQNFAGDPVMHMLTGGSQTLTGGPVASQEAIKELGTNGGGFYNVNSAHPFENPTPFTNLLEIYLLLLDPLRDGVGLRPDRQGPPPGPRGRRRDGAAAVDLDRAAHLGRAGRARHRAAAAGGAMEGKETRFGEAASALFGAATTGTSTGAVNSMHDSFTAPGGGVALFNMMLGEIAPGGMGSGLYGMLMLAVVTVFLAGLMVGRTPEYLGKKIGQREIVLVASRARHADPAPGRHRGRGHLRRRPGGHPQQRSARVLRDARTPSPRRPTTGSAFGGITTGTPFWNTLLGLLMLFGRFLPMIFVLALAGRFASAKRLPASAGTLPTHRPLFVVLLTGVALVVVGLTYVPVLFLGPVVESLS